MTVSPAPDPILILVEPQLGANIGLAARAALNCGLDQMRLVRPREGWPNPSALAAAGAAAETLENADLFEDVASATEDLSLVFAATARPRQARIPVDTVDEAIERHRATPMRRCGILFGPEASGLDANALGHAHRILTFPTSSRYPSLNLAHAVLLFCWSWRQSSKEPYPKNDQPEDAPATNGAIAAFLSRLDARLEERRFFHSEGGREKIHRDLQHLIRRAEPSAREIALLQGALSALTNAPIESNRNDIQ